MLVHPCRSKALTIINHCLFQGSEFFATWFRENREFITSLCTFHVLAVKQLAVVTLNLLDDGIEDSGTELSSLSSTTPRAPPPSRRAQSTDSDSISLHEHVKDLTAFITTVGEHPIASGGYAFVYQATLTVGSSTELVSRTRNAIN